MTKEDAIKTLKELLRETNDSWYEEVYNMAIDALNADRKTEPQYDFGEYADRLWKIAYERGKADRLQGHYIKGENGEWYCSECRRIDDKYSVARYCWYCGCRMKGADDE